MIKNYFKIAFRNLWRRKGFSLINIMGLTLGLTACILIGLFVWDENQYDKFVPNADRVYRIYTDYTGTSGTQRMAVGSPMFAVTLKKDFPEVEQTARVMMHAPYKMLFEAGKNKFYEEDGYFVDSTFLDVIPLSFIYGTPVKALDGRSSVVISQQMAKRFFGNENPVGKQILVNKGPYQITGVFEKNEKFHLQFDFLIPLAAIGLPADRMEKWGWHQFFTYVKLKPETNAHALELKFQNEVKQIEKALPDAIRSTDVPFLQPLKKIHLYSAGFKFDPSKRGNITYVNALIIIAAFILLIACFNFINLATAKSLQRAKEVGVRKTIGAGKKQLMFQFIGETILLAFICILISIGFAAILLPWLNQFAGKQISFMLLLNPVTIILFLVLGFAVGILAGFYPALVLSHFKPVHVLKGNLSPGQSPNRGVWLRHILVVIQFTLSVLLIICAIVVFRQVDYLHNKDLGFNKDQIMFFPMRGDKMFHDNEAFKNELLRSPGVSSVSIGYGYPGDAVAGDEIMVMKDGEKIAKSATQLTVDYDYVKTLGLQIIEGRDFSRTMANDKDHAWIINETAVKELGLGTPQKAIGQTLAWHPWGASNPDSLKIGQIVGVVKDFNYKSLYDKVQTAIIQIFPDAAWKVAVKMKTAGIGNTITTIKKVWDKFSPDYPIEYKFLDENFEEMYTSEDKLKSLLWIFTGIAIFVGCLGLFGLATYAAESRRKEVGIRKILGATTQGIVVLLSKDFIRLVLVSLVIASPIAWYFMNKWLEDFAYRINIAWWIFGATGVLVIFIAIATVSIQALKAALANPVKSLRAE